VATDYIKRSYKMLK